MTTPVEPVPIAPGPAVPSSAAPEATFDVMYEEFNAWEKDELQPGANALAAATYTNALAAAEAAIAATGASAAAVAAANFKGAWGDLSGALAIPASVAHADSVWMLLESVADVTAHEPGASASWQKLTGSVPPLLRVARTSNTMLVAADKGKFFEASGTFTQTLDSEDGLGGGWWVYYRNGGTGVITLGSTIVVPGETLLLVCNGVDVLHQAVEIPRPKGYRVMVTVSGDWIAPAHGYYLGIVQGAGGSGGAVSASPCAATGGAAGGRARKFFKCAAGTAIACTVGAGGAATAFTTGANGNAGGDTTFIGGPVSVTAYGGAGGTYRNTVGSLTGAVGGTAIGGDDNWQGGGSGDVTNTSAGGTTAAASGGGSAPVNGVGFASGAATVSTAANLARAATGGAGVGGGSGDCTVPSGTSVAVASGGGSAAMASDALSATSGSTSGVGAASFTNLLVQHNSAGGNGNASGNAVSASGNGGGGGGATAGASGSGGAGVLDAGGGAAAIAASASASNGSGAGGLGAGSGGMANWAAAYTVRSASGGNGYVIVEG